MQDLWFLLLKGPGDVHPLLPPKRTLIIDDASNKHIRVDKGEVFNETERLVRVTLLKI